MHFPFARSIVVVATLSAIASPAWPQINAPDNDTVRVSVTLNPDGSRTAYQFDQAHHKATATTTAPDGKVVTKIRYEIDDTGRFASGLIFGPDKKLLFKSLYKYGSDGHLEQEIHLNKDDAVLNKMIYTYDAAGRQTGYSVVDASGKLLGRTSPVQATGSPSPKPRKKH